MGIRSSVIVVAALGVIWALSICGASAQQSADIFTLKDKAFSLYIGSGPGGGYDQYGRLLARHIGRYLPGAPTVIPRNMPGGSGREVMNHIYNIAPKDGTAIAITLHAVPFDPLFGGKATKIDANRVTWIGSMNADTNVCISWHAAPFRSFADIERNPLIVGSPGSSSANSVLPKLLNKLADTKLKIVEGYQGSAAIFLAMQRGEVEGTCGVTWDQVKAPPYKELLDGKKIIPLIQFAMDRSPDLPDVAFIMELAKTEADRQLAGLILGSNKMGRPIFAPPDLPSDRVEILRRAFDAVMKDPELLADASKMGIAVGPVNGIEVESLVKRLYVTPESVVEAARQILGGR